MSKPAPRRRTCRTFVTRRPALRAPCAAVPAQRRGRRALPVALAALAPLFLAACTEDPVAWEEAAEVRLPAPPVAAATPPDAAADSLLRRAVVSAAALPDTGEPPPLPAGLQSLIGTACSALVRVAPGRGAERVAAWWTPRPDGSAALFSARSTDGGATWDRPAPVDTLDRSEAGCARPAPAVAVDTVNGYVHVAYTLAAPEGRGVFYAHRMDPRAAFEPPRVIVYGDRPAATWVTSHNDLVLVAYEDPNTGGRPFVSLALSRSGGHTWDERFAASEGSMSAERPVVALRGTRVALGWVERTAPRALTPTDDPRSATAPLPSGVVVRVGRLR